MGSGHDGEQLRGALLDGKGTQIPDDLVIYGGIVEADTTNLVTSVSPGLLKHHFLEAGTTAIPEFKRKGVGFEVIPFAPTDAGAMTEVTITVAAGGKYKMAIVQVKVDDGAVSVKYGDEVDAAADAEIPEPDADNIIICVIGPIDDALAGFLPAAIVDNGARTVGI
jgi:hypothetical protein